MISKQGQQAITITSKGKQELKFDQLKDLTTKIFFFKSHAENEAKRLALDVFLLFIKALIEVKAIGPQLSFNIFR